MPHLPWVLGTTMFIGGLPVTWMVAAQFAPVPSRRKRGGLPAGCSAIILAWALLLAPQAGAASEPVPDPLPHAPPDAAPVKKAPVSLPTQPPATQQPATEAPTADKPAATAP